MFKKLRNRFGGRHQIANEFEVSGTRTVTADRYKVELDLSSQVLAIEVPRDHGWFSIDQADQLGNAEAPVSATLGPIDSTDFVSAAVLAQKAKIFDDGLYAAVEVAAQEGAGRHAGKARLLTSLGCALAGADPSEAGQAQELLLGAARLGTLDISGVPPAVEARVQRAVEAFLASDLRSKPIGFYTWSEQLRRIFHQDRMLQGEIDAAGMTALASALRADPSARAIYEGHLRFLTRFTNPFANPDLRTFLHGPNPRNVDAAEADIRFFPPSVGHETEIIKMLFGNQPIPDNFVLVDEMIRRIRSSELDLAPQAESGWYDYQTWALEALVIPERMPEAKRLQIDEEYRKLLLDLFKGLLTLSRETHVKQLDIAACGSAMGRREVYIDIAPALSAEPLVTFYLRRALGYQFVRAVLEETFGPGQLELLHRLTPAGPATDCLAEELDGIESLFLGAHATVSKELGLAPDTASGSDASASEAAGRFAAWARNLNSDSDLAEDLRAMVPVFYDVQRRKTKVWVFLGWSSRPITVSFARPPNATIVDKSGKPSRNHPRVRWGTLFAQLHYPVTAELYVDQILDRDEFRRLCDFCGTRSEMINYLSAL